MGWWMLRMHGWSPRSWKWPSRGHICRVDMVVMMMVVIRRWILWWWVPWRGAIRMWIYVPIGRPDRNIPSKARRSSRAVLCHMLCGSSWTWRCTNWFLSSWVILWYRLISVWVLLEHYQVNEATQFRAHSMIKLLPVSGVCDLPIAVHGVPQVQHFTHLYISQPQPVNIEECTHRSAKRAAVFGRPPNQAPHSGIALNGCTLVYREDEDDRH
mmetsp:Transcript_8202/g.19271  ORF Transcript_8202/g.19271 Transcript_8202/m.19271 type:complete len:212 (+) Transcript_8202:340-975(+)